MFGWFFADTVFTTMETTPLPGLINFTASGSVQVHNQATGAFGFLDGIIAFVLVIMIGTSFALAFYSRGHPFLAVIGVFSQILFIFSAYFVKLFWQGFTTSTPALQAVALNHFPIANTVLTYIPFISFITLIGIIVLSFTKPNEEYAAGV